MDILAMLIATHLGYALAIFVGGHVVTDYFEWGYFEKPKNWLQKCTNFIMNILVGSGYHVYKRLVQFPWILRKLLFAFIYFGGAFLIWIVFI